MAKKEKRKLTTRQYATAIAGVAKTTYKAAPLAVIVQLIGSIITAVLPIVTTYFAALTTTALAEAYAGNPHAGEQAMIYVIVTASLGIIMTAWGSIERYVTQLMRYRVEAGMSDRMYEKFLTLDFWRYDDKETADLYDRASQFARFFPYVFDSLARILTQFIAMIAGLGALILVSWWLGLIVVVAVIPGIWIQFRLSRRSTKHWNENVNVRRSQNMIEWSLLQPKHIAELRLYGVVRYLLDLRMQLRDKDEKARIDFERASIFKKLGADALEAIAEVIALLWIVTQIIAREQPIGQFIYVQQVVSRALGGASGFVSAISGVDEDIANLFDYQEFMALPSRTIKGKKLTGASLPIELRNIRFKYPHAEKEVLHGISITIQPHQHIAIVGENGAGKSTLIKILTGLYDPTGGSVMIGGTNLKDIDITSWHNLLGVLQQEYLSYGFPEANGKGWHWHVTSIATAPLLF